MGKTEKNEREWRWSWYIIRAYVGTDPSQNNREKGDFENAYMTLFYNAFDDESS